MPRLKLPDYLILRDTRERAGHGWLFDSHYENHMPPRCIGTAIAKLDTGDYSVKGYEDILAIERKEDLSELWVNYLSDKERLENEFERLAKLKYKWMIIESLLVSESWELSPPQVRKSVPGKAMIRWLLKLSVLHNVPILFGGSESKRMARYLMEEAIRAEKDRWIPY